MINQYYQNLSINYSVNALIISTELEILSDVSFLTNNTFNE